jgi:hypothetical protein
MKHGDIHEMVTENSKRIKRISRLFYLGAAFMALASLVLFLYGRDVWGFVAAAAVVVWFVVFQAIDFQFVSLETAGGRLTLRYYSVARFGRREYHSMEFPLTTLHDYRLEKSMFGLVRDLVLVVRTRQGIAEYDPVSLAALNPAERQMIETELKLALKR